MTFQDRFDALQPVTDAILDTLHTRGVPPLEGLAALAYCLGAAAGLQSKKLGADLDLEQLFAIARASFDLGKFG